MSVLIKGMKMPSTGLYFVSVDNTGGRDKTVVTVERMLGNRDVRQIVGSFELVPVLPHGRGIDADALKASLVFAEQTAEWAVPALRAVLTVIDEMPTIIPEEKVNDV